MPSKLSHIGPRLQVAALPWRQISGRLEVMLITSRLSRHWLLPKGWPMKGKTPAQAAAKEALQEAGIKGQVSAEPVGSYTYEKLTLQNGAIPCIVEVYPLRVEEELGDWKECVSRERSWMPIETASMIAYESGLADLLATLDHSLIANSSPFLTRRAAGKKR